ncbi:DUF1824 family protein [Anthocerotibacter panamensis]|uniref:DUF1824 family protein n=1 Tax=Anthocerotibacter panamensis TaxID=2857077 RepID=UPI001C408C33|nr:DUF1824 family protein [Anthocerotibacter panamensis]
MVSQEPIHFTPETAHSYLKRLTFVPGNSSELAEQKPQLRAALLLVAQHSDYQIFGVCADAADQGLAALRSYLKALGYQTTLEITPISGPVYIKFNANTALFYLDTYPGHERGVLVSCHSSHEGGIRDIYGYLPLDLFAPQE